MNMSSQLSVKETLDQQRSSQGKTKRKIFGVVILLLLLAGFAAFYGMKEGAKKGRPMFDSVAVSSGNLAITVTATGNLEATNQVDVGSELSGIVTTVLADYNDIVKEGQPLAYLDDTKYKAAVQKSKAEVASAKASYQEAVAERESTEKTFNRYTQTRKLTNNQMPSIEVLDQAEADYKKAVASVASAEAAVMSAEASLKSDEVDLSKTVVYSPTDGIVLDRDIDEGQTVAASLEAPVLFTVAEDLRKMELQVDIDEADVGQVVEGQKGVFTVDAYPDESFNTTITQVRYGADTNDGVVTYTAVLDVQNPDLLLRPGMTATADITVKEVKEHLLLPNSALRFTPAMPTPGGGNGSDAKSDNRSFLSKLMPGPPPHDNNKSQVQQEKLPANQGKIWVVDANGMPKEMIVQKIASDGIMTAVTSDTLKEGMHVITNELSQPK